MTRVADAIYRATATSPLEPGEYAVVEKAIVNAILSQERKAPGRHVLAFGLDGAAGGKGKLPRR